MLDNDEMTHVAFHEAGHAVIAIVLGIPLGCTSIEAIGNVTPGHTRTACNVPNNPVPDHDCMAVALAGYSAERVLLGTINEVPHVARDKEEDEFAFAELAARTAPWDTPSLKREIENECNDLVKAHSAAIRSVAQRLLERGRLSVTDVLDALDEAEPNFARKAAAELVLDACYYCKRDLRSPKEL